jgi:hypothetical protein
MQCKLWQESKDVGQLRTSYIRVDFRHNLSGIFVVDKLALGHNIKGSDFLIVF